MRIFFKKILNLYVSIKIFCIFAFLFLQSMLISAQNISPDIQYKIDSISAWITKQYESNGTIDQKVLDSMNQSIREAQKRLSVANSQCDGKSKSQSDNKEEGKIIIRDMMPGSVFTVPEGVVWKIKRVSCKSDMGSYSVLVTSVKFKEQYEAGEKISMPAFTSEASLLSEDTSSVIYKFEIIEIPNPK